MFFMKSRKSQTNRKILLIFVSIAFIASNVIYSPVTRTQAWGSALSHNVIGTEAIKSLPSPWQEFFSNYSLFFEVHTNDPDGYRSKVEDSTANQFNAEHPRHFDDHDIKAWGDDMYDITDPQFAHLIDGEFTEEDLPFTVIDKPWNSMEYQKGVIEWTVSNLTRDLTQLMVEVIPDPLNNTKWSLIFITMSYLSHYASDATMPFHGTVNYLGQLTGNSGLHAYIEDIMMEHSSYGHLDDVIFTNIPASYVESPFNQTVQSIETSLANVSVLLEADDNFNRAEVSWIDNMWNATGNMISARIDLAAQRTADLWYTALVDSDLINQINSTFLSSITLDFSNPPPGWTSASDDYGHITAGSLWYPTIAPRPIISTTTSTAEKTDDESTPGIDFLFALLLLMGLVIVFTRTRKS
jgi:hypothetical protein